MAHMVTTYISKHRRPFIFVSMLAMALLLMWGTVAKPQAQSPPPRVGIESQDDVTEGQSAVFTVTAAKAPLSDLIIPITVHEYPPQGSVAAIGQTGARSVTILSGQTQATLNVATDNDSTTEPRGIITAIIDTPSFTSGYLVDATSAYSSVIVSDDDDPTPQVTVRGWKKRSAFGENSLGVRFEVQASPAPQDPITVNLNVTTTGDYGVQAGAHTVVVPTTNDSVIEFFLPLTDDTLNEPNGTVTATVQAGSDYTIGNPSSATVAIIDNDTPQVRISAGPGIEEGEDATFTVSASPRPYQALSVNVNIAASSEVSGVTNGVRTVSVPTSGTAKFTVGTTDDSNYTALGFGTITATVKSGSRYIVGWPSSATVDVADNDGPEVSITAGAGVTEGADATFTLTANPPVSNGVTVNLTVVATGDFGVNAGAKTVWIPASGSKTYNIGTTDDAFDEPDGTVKVTVDTGTGYRVGTASSATVNVADDEATPSSDPVLTLAAGADIDEGDDASFTITATPPVPDGQTLTVSIDPSVPGLINIPFTVEMTGATHTFTQFSDDNDFDEPDYSLSLKLKPGSGYTLGDPYEASVTVRDDDPAKVRLSASRSSIDEDGAVTFSLNVNPLSDNDLTVSVEVTATGDFGIPTGARQFSIPARTGGASFTIRPIPDQVYEPDGSVTVTVQPNSAIEIVGSAANTVTVKDDDPVPGPRIQVEDPVDRAKAGGKLEFVITLSNTWSETVSVDYNVGTLAWQLLPETDFYDDDGEVSGTIEFAPGERQKVVDVHISPWAPVEHRDRIYVELLNAVNGSIPLMNGFAIGYLTNR